MFTLQKICLYYCSCSWSLYSGPATGSLYISSWFCFKCSGALESFLSSKKCINAQSNNSIKFVKAGAKFSKYTKRVHSEEWHQKKFFKYDLLTTSIRYNGWSVYFFAIEVGARRYCSTSLKSCLFHLGLPGKLVWPILNLLVWPL